jgi:transposase-like protein
MTYWYLACGSGRLFTVFCCLRRYLRYSLSYRDLEEMMTERNLNIDHTTIYCWVQRYGPEIDKRIRPHHQTLLRTKPSYYLVYRI